MRSANKPEPPPELNQHPACWDLFFRDFASNAQLAADIRDRDIAGAKKYGVRLQPFNGRNPLVDLYQELLDAIVYAVQHRYEATKRDDDIAARRATSRVQLLVVVATAVRTEIGNGPTA